MRDKEKLVVLGLWVTGLVQMTLHPRKSYRLIVHGVGWYE